MDLEDDGVQKIEKKGSKAKEKNEMSDKINNDKSNNKVKEGKKGRSISNIAAVKTNSNIINNNNNNQQIDQIFFNLKRNKTKCNFF